MRYGDVVRVPAVAVDPKEAGLGAEVLVASQANRAAPASDPRIYKANIARKHTVSVGASSYDFARGLVPERQWYGDAAVPQRQLATEAKVVAAARAKRVPASGSPVAST